jgi:hypothetical protein
MPRFDAASLARMTAPQIRRGDHKGSRISLIIMGNSNSRLCRDAGGIIDIASERPTDPQPPDERAQVKPMFGHATPISEFHDG